MITLNNIAFSYNDKPVIDGLSLEVRRGEWLGLVGPNGAGKTTLLNLMSGALVSSGQKPVASSQEISSIKINGRGVSTYPRKELAKIMAVVPQSSPFAFSFSALEVVLMGRYPYLKRFGFETEADIKIAREAMEKTDTWQFRDRPIDQLSGGERQRVIIARALAEEPEILLLDEPTTFLDIKHQSDIMQILTDLNKNTDLTIISAIHDINLAITYCSKIALLHIGKVHKIGTPEEVITYANLKEVFGAEVYVGINELSNKPYYIPMSTSLREGQRPTKQ